MTIRARRELVGRDGVYYSIPRTKSQIKEAGEEMASEIPDRYVRNKREAVENGCFDYAMKNRREVKTPYKSGDVIAYQYAENLGTKKYPDIIRAVYFDVVYKVTPKTIQFGKKFYTGRNISKEYVIGKVKKE